MSLRRNPAHTRGDPQIVEEEAMTIFETLDLRPASFVEEWGFSPIGMAIGQGSQAIEIVIAKSNKEPTTNALREMWKKRRGNRAAPVVCLVLYGDKAAIIGPSGEEPPIQRGVDATYAEQLCIKALREPDRHMATRLILDILPDLDTAIPGLHNEGLLATHELTYGVPKRQDWGKANKRSKDILKESGKNIVRALGYKILQTTGPISILQHEGRKSALALFLDQNESMDSVSDRFSNRTPVSYALARAEEERLPYLISIRERALRLYPVESGVGVGNKGLTETYVEIDLDLLSPEHAGYLWLIFSGEAILPSGPFEDILSRSKDYASDLSTRLRQRIYSDVIPQFSEGIARAQNVDTPTADELDITYRMALTLLFRLLFIAYAEDKELLPYRTNDLYRKRSLKDKAHELLEIKKTGGKFSQGNTYWNDIWNLFDAVNNGKPEWNVPAYDGGLFSNDKETSKAGALLQGIELPDQELGPPLTKLLIDESEEGEGPVDFRSLGVREFGTIYEGLLESELSVAENDLSTDENGFYIPIHDKSKAVVLEGDIYLHNASGRRKSSGTYFTKSFAVDHLLDHALEPALENHVIKLDALKDADAGDLFFDFRVADIAMGSGHFLVAAIDRIEKKLSDFLARRPIPGVLDELNRLRNEAQKNLEELGGHFEVDDNQLLRRQIARHCIFGVDLNPMAVDLAKLSIWIHTFIPGLPLSLLDYNLVVGNSLVGIATLEEASDVLGGDNSPLFAFKAKELLGDAEKSMQKFGKIADANTAEIAAAKDAHQMAMDELKEPNALFDILTAARIDDEIHNKIETGQAIRWTKNIEKLPNSDEHKKAISALKSVPPFHFPLVFPQVFLRANPGFDVILGNPPWEEATLEEDRFWLRYEPGLQGLRSAEQEKRKEELRVDRPDLVSKFNEEAERIAIIRHALVNGPYPGMGSGDPDLYKGFIWRFWNLIREREGSLGVVLPRSAFNAKGASEFREAIINSGEIIDLTILLNTGGWVFDDAEHRYTIALFSMRKEKPGKETTIPLKGPYNSDLQYLKHKEDQPITFLIDDVLRWTDTAALPLLPTDKAGEVFAQLRKAPRLDLDEEDNWRARPTTDLHATNDKKYEINGEEVDLMIFADKQPKGAWPVFKGASFDIWNPDTGEYYAYADPKIASARLQAKRERGHKNSNSAFSEFSSEWIENVDTLPCNYPRIAFRDVTNRTNTRTVVVSLVPPNIFITNKGPYFLWPRGDGLDEAYLLGVMSSIPLDWYARRFVEMNMNFHILNPFPIPRPPRDNSLWQRVVQLAGRLAAPDDRFAEWAKKVGVEHGPLDPKIKEEMIHELDAVVAHLYGLNAGQLTHIFETFHEGWDFTGRLKKTLAYFDKWGKSL